jgi:hypothetical protein
VVQDKVSSGSFKRRKALRKAKLSKMQLKFSPISMCSIDEMIPSAERTPCCSYVENNSLSHLSGPIRQVIRRKEADVSE